MRVEKDDKDFKIHAIVVKYGDHLWHVVELTSDGGIITNLSPYYTHKKHHDIDRAHEFSDVKIHESHSHEYGFKGAELFYLLAQIDSGQVDTNPVPRSDFVRFTYFHLFLSQSKGQRKSALASSKQIVF